MCTVQASLSFGPSFGPSVSPYNLYNTGMYIFNSKFRKVSPKMAFSYSCIAYICHILQIASMETLSCRYDNKSNAIYERYD